MDPKTTRVLLLDDDPNLRAVLSDILKVEGIESVPVETGAAALARIEQQDIDVVLIDLKLEDMSGLEVLRGIKTRSPEIECIMLTGHASQATAIKAINLGAYSYFQKPYDVDQLLFAIRRAAEKHTAGYSLRASESNQRMILNNIDEIVYSVEQITPNSPEGIPRFVSDRTEHILGFQPHEFLENPSLWFSLIHPDDTPVVQAQTATISASRQTGKREYRMRHKTTGEYRWMEDLVVPRLDENGNLIGTFGVARDITERKRTEAERQALLEILQGVAVTESLQELLELIRQSLAKVIYAENFFVVFHNKSSNLFDEVFAVDKYDPPMPPSKLERSITSYVFRTGEPLLLTQAKFEELAARGEVELVGTKPAIWLGAPLKTPSETIGVIVVQNYEDPDCYTERDREFLASVGVQVSLAIERKQAEVALQQAEEKFRTLVEQSTAIIYIVEPGRDSPVSYISPQIEQVLGFTPEEWIRQPGLWESLLHPEDRERVLAENDHSDLSGEPFRSEYRIHTKDGRVIWLSDECLNVRDERGQIIYMQGIETDITERKRAEETLRTSEERYRMLAENMSDTVWLMDMSLRTTYISPSVTRLRGFTLDEINTIPLDRQMPPDSLQRALQTFAETLSPENLAQPDRTISRTVELEFFKKDGTKAWSENTFTLIRDPQGQPFAILGSGRDIDERKNAQETLQNSEKYFRALIENNTDAIVLVDPRGMILYESPTSARMLGRATGQRLGKSGYEYIHAEDRGSVAQMLNELVQHPGEIRQTTFRNQHKDGSWRWIEATATNLLGESAVHGLVINMHDITQRKRIEEKVEEERILLRTLIDNLPDRIFVMDVQGRKIISNIADWRASGGKTMEDVIGKTDLDTYPPELAEGYWALDKTVIDTGISIINREEPGLDSQGNPVWVLSSKLPLRDGQGKVVGLVGIGHDITQRKQAEEEIRHRLTELESLSQVSDSLTSAIDLQPLLENILAGARNAIPAAEKGTILLAEPDGVLRLHAMTGYTDPRLMGLVLPNQKGYAARVARERRPIKIDDAQAEYEAPYNGKIEEIDAVQSGIAAPLIVKGKVIGVISLDNASRKASFTESDLRLLVTFASSAAVAIENARLFSETQQRLNRLSALHSIDAAIGASVDTKVTLNIVLEHVITELKADAAAVLLFNPLTMMLEYAAGSGFRLHVIEGLRLRLGEGLAGQSVLQRRAIHIADLRQASEVEQLLEPPVSGSASAPLQYLEGENFVAYHAIPLIAKGQVQGVLEIFRRTPMPVDQEWINFFEMLAGQTALAIDNGRLFENLQHSNLELTLAYDATIQGWSQALELRDEETEGHTRRVTELTLRLIQAMGLEEVEKEHARRGALLHDIGKMAIPDSILLKDGPLNEHEWDVMRLHPQYAFNLLSPITYLAPALHIPYCHHEKWDGSGYPRGLKGEEIPEVARIFAIVDVYDALTSNRPYRLAWTREKAMEYIREQSGMHFDPKIVNAFMDLMAGEK